MYNRPIVAKLGQVSQISVDRCFSIDKRAAIFSNWGAVLPNHPRSELQTPDRSDLVVSRDQARLRSLSKIHNRTHGCTHILSGLRRSASSFGHRG